ncbi:MAG: SUMF1/EgtB/PvdO family nonheme iron enzyme [Myxococcales bacterium]|nr:SUMF1/EgtB/PvdO family nonheme iron enzyme [Myxococcales bacterium]
MASPFPLPCRALALGVLLAACGGPKDTGTGGPGAADTTAPLLAAAEDDEPDAAVPAQQHESARGAGERADVPAGAFVAGRTPGDRGRDPTLEPALLAVELGDFAVARLPYPNDPRQRPLTNVSRAKAGELCAADGGRLCTELEWERACRGPKGQAYAGGERWDPSCATAPETCASGFGALAMGGAMREWTASDVEPVEGVQARAAAVRGARADAADVDHRCAHRLAVAAEAAASDLGFRCCYGTPSTASIPAPRPAPVFQKAELPAARLATMFAAVPQLAGLAGDVKYFREEQAIDSVRRRATSTPGTDAGDPLPPQAELTTAPLAWSPVPGEELLLVTGLSGKDSFIAAFHRLPGDRFRVAATFVMTGDPGPVVLVFNQNVKRKLEWATCLGCYGETGGIAYREDNRVVITQR